MSAFKGLGRTQLYVLVEMDCHGEQWLPIWYYADLSGFDHAAVYRTMRSLLKRGLIEVRKDPKQRTVNLYRCTALGHQIGWPPGERDGERS